MIKESEKHEIICNMLIATKPDTGEKYVQSVVFIHEGLEFDTQVHTQAIKLRCMQSNADSLIKCFLNDAMTDIGEGFIMDHIQAESEFQDIKSALTSALHSRVGMCH